VIRVSTPAEPRDAAALVAPFEAALTSRTRVLAFSHHSNVSGVALPAAQLCRLARDRGILTHVDGAQTFGWLDLRLGDMGCDFYAASSHKWFMGPKEAGVLYVRRESVDKLWPLVVGLGWERAHEEKSAARFATLGQRDDATVAAMGRAVAFHESIGAEAVEARVRELVATLRTRIGDSIPGVRFHTPADPGLSGGVLIFQIPGVEPRAGFQALYDSHDVGSAGMSGSFPGIRLSPHVYNTLSEAERVAEAVASLA
jgi:selenocysteine lyase/cysteine desulfurase